MNKIIKEHGSLVDGVIGISKWEGNKEPVLTIHHNTMSEHAQNVLLGLSASLLLNGASPTPFNRLSFTTPGMRLQDNYGNDEEITLYYNKDTSSGKLGLAVFFLNLDVDELLNLNNKSKFIPITDENGNLSNKVVAYGTYDVTNDSTKTGLINFSDYTKIPEDFSCANGWLFEAQKHSFEYNVIAIGTLDKINTFAAYKCISKVNLYNQGNAITENFIMPGFNGITGPNEILLNYTQGGLSRWKYNLKTGVTTAVEKNETAANNISMTNKKKQQLVLNDKLYSIYSYTFEVFDTNGNKVANKSIDSDYSIEGLFTDGVDVYISTTDRRNYGNASMFKIDQSNYSTTRIANANFTGWGNLPDNFDISNTSYIKSSYKENDVTYYVVGDVALDVQFICSDIMNVKTSRVADAPQFDCVFNIDNTPEGTFFVCGGTNTNSGPSTNSAFLERSMCAMLPLNKIRKSEGTGYIDNTYQNTGVWINNNKFSNFLSFKKYDTMQSKTIAQNMVITYGYEIGLRT